MAILDKQQARLQTETNHNKLIVEKINLKPKMYPQIIER